MNFILKNIGWIALFIFFAIMLLIISANQKDNLVTNKALQDAKKELVVIDSESVKSGTGVLTDLVKLLDDDDNIPEIKSIKKDIIEEVMEKKDEVVEEVMEKKDDIVEEVMEKKEEQVVLISGEADVKQLAENKDGAIKTFFARFKRGDKKDSQDIVSEDIMEKTDDQEEDDLIEKELVSKDEVTTIKKTIAKDSTKKKTSYKNKSYNKGTFKDIPTYHGNFSVNQKALPGVHLKTAIGNTYKLAVDGLKLNNAYFNKSLGILKQGDVVKQLTSANKYGCFQAHVISGDISGKKGYVCKKWFKSYAAPQAHAVKNIVSTKIGDIHSVAATQLKLNNKYFNSTIAVMNQGDKLDQLGAENSHGCFQVRILTGNTDNIGKVGYVCKKYLSVSSGTLAAAQSNSTALQSYALSRSTKIGDTHTVSAHSLKLNNANFNKNLGYLSYGDTVKQLTVENMRGCFSVEVLSSAIASSTGKVGFVCKKYLR